MQVIEYNDLELLIQDYKSRKILGHNILSKDEPKKLSCGFLDKDTDEHIIIKLNKMKGFLTTHFSKHKREHFIKFSEINEGSTLIKLLDYEYLNLYDVMSNYLPVKSACIEIKEACEKLCDVLDQVMIFYSEDDSVLGKLKDTHEKISLIESDLKQLIIVDENL